MPLNRTILTSYFFIFFVSQQVYGRQVDTVKSSFKFKNDTGIFMEQFDSSNVNDNRFTEDNVIYTAGKVFIFDYSYSKNDKKFFFKPSDNTYSSLGAWEFVPAEEKDSNTITGVKMVVKSGLQGFEQISKGYSQTVIQYKFLTDSSEATFSEQTGLVENEKNIWMHPPRTMLFRILEINPFPFITQNSISNWEWRLMIGSHWGDERWKTWKGQIENRMEYKDKGFEDVTTPFGSLKCRKVIAEGKVPWGCTTLVSYFNEKYGFVKLMYTNIDGSLLEFNLKSIQN